MTIVMQQKTQRHVLFEITDQTKEAVVQWINQAGLRTEDSHIDLLMRMCRSLMRPNFSGPKCGGPMRVIALIEVREVIRVTLQHLRVWDPRSSGIAERPPPPEPAVD
jgi:hypothetical protein